jgi:N-dimethylarginine dimethylaminohydrolase
MEPQEYFGPKKNNDLKKNNHSSDPSKWETFSANQPRQNVEPEKDIASKGNDRRSDPSIFESLTTRQANATVSTDRRIEEVLVKDETGPLIQCFVGRADTFGSAPNFSINCETIKRAIAQNKLAKLDKLPQSEIEEEIKKLRETLKQELFAFEVKLRDLGVEVLLPVKIATQEQMFPRDPLIVIGSKIIKSNMAEPSRKNEFDGIKPFLDPNLLVDPPQDVRIEGGDIMVHGGKIYVGVGGPRTNQSAVEFLEKTFPEMAVVTLQLAPAKEGEDVLHLDCCLNFLGRGHVLMYPGGFLDPAGVRRQLHSSEIIEVSHEEQLKFATNILSVTPNDIVSRYTTPIINQQLTDKGYTVHLVEFSTVELFGGSFRCATHPLRRGV